MIIDCHAHIYSRTIMENVLRIEGLANLLHLDKGAVAGRADKADLRREAAEGGVQACLLLPVAPVSGVSETNDQFLKMVEGETDLFTAGAIHPSAQNLDEELEKLDSRGVQALKLSSFTQKFDLDSEENCRLFKKIKDHNAQGNRRFFVILDTFYQADRFFNASSAFVTTPEKLGRLAAQFPEIDFIAAHMGGLAAPFNEIEKHLTPRNNLYLDTSNAAHMLSRKEFIRLMTMHGPDRILFGTDWPWFGHKEEVEFIQGLLNESGFTQAEQSKIFGGNISRLLSLNPGSVV
jgi:predicted TIM-barrel fold metal-dependent hydrolase